MMGGGVEGWVRVKGQVGRWGGVEEEDEEDDAVA